MTDSFRIRCAAVACVDLAISQVRPFCDGCWSEVDAGIRKRIVALTEGHPHPAPAIHDAGVYQLVSAAKLNLAVTKKIITPAEGAARMSLACHRAKTMIDRAAQAAADGAQVPPPF